MLHPAPGPEDATPDDALTPDELAAAALVQDTVRRLLRGVPPSEGTGLLLQRLVLLDALLGALPDLAVEAAGIAPEAGPWSPSAPEPVAEATPAGPQEGIFHARPPGGVILTREREIILPARVVVAARLQEGDRVRLEPDGVLPDGGPRYFFRNLSLAEAADARVGYVVERPDGLWVTADSGLIGGLAPDDREQWGITPGDVVTVRPRADGLVRVLKVHVAAPQPWRRAVGQPITARRVRRPGGASTADRAPDGPRLPEGTRIALVGGHEANRPHYLRIFEALGAEVDFLPGGTYPRFRVEDMVDWCDAVILLAQCAGHEMINVARHRAKVVAKPLIWGRTENWTGLLRQVRRELAPMLTGDGQSR